MLLRIKKRLEQELKNYILGIDKNYHLNKISPLISKNIKEFVLRKGKRIRPILFCIGYLGFTKKVVPGLFRCAISLELLHDFMLIHDDIIDKSDIRRGKPSMHIMLEKDLPNEKLKFNGKDLAIVIGDVIYALALNAFLSIKEKHNLKEQALRYLIAAALYTGSGEFIELILSIKKIEDLTKKDIYKIYKYKTAIYTFATPLAMGAILAKAKKNQINTLFEYGIRIGVAFQIKDDIIGIFGKPSEIGKSNLTDLKEAKKTVLIWHAYNNSKIEDKKILEKILENKQTTEKDLKKAQKIILKTGSVDFAKKEIIKLKKEAEKILKNIKMDKKYKDLLKDISNEILVIEDSFLL